MLKIVPIDEADIWNSIVKSFDNYDVYYLPEYSKAFKLHGDGDPFLIYYYDEDIRAINVVMRRDIENDKNFSGKVASKTFFDFTTPYGYGGFNIEGRVNDESVTRLNEAYSNYCVSNNVISEFVRFHPLLKNSQLNQSMYEIIDLGRTITIDLTSKEQIWADLSSKNRNVIRKAKKSGVDIYWGRSTSLMKEFIPLYNATMDKDEAIPYYYFNNDFYQSVLKDLKYNFLFFYAMYQKKIISMSIILFNNKNMHYHLSASNKEFQNLAATNLLLYEAAAWGHENGYKSFHLGGGLGSREDNLFKFKKAFNKESDTFFSIGKKIFDHKIYNELLYIQNKHENGDKNSSFFPAYRR